MRTTLLVLFALALSATASAAEYRDEARRLKMSVPDRYEPMPKTPPQLLAAWYYKGRNADDLWTLTLSEIDGLLPRDGVPASATPAGMTSTFISWNGERITCLRMPEKSGDLEYVNFQALLPTTPRGLRVTMGALIAHETELKTAFVAVVNGIEAPVQYHEAGTSPAVLKILQGAAMIAIAGGLVIWFRRNTVDRK